MHIVYLFHDTNPFCGASKAMIYVIKTLVQRGDKATVVVPDNKGITTEFLKDGIDCVVVPFRSGIYPPHDSIRNKLMFIPRLLLWRYYNVRAVRTLYAVFKDINVDIIHSNSSVLDVGYNLARRLDCNHIYHIREFVNDYLNTSYFPSNRVFKQRVQAINKYSYTICIIPDLQALFGLEGSCFSRVIYDGVMNSCTRMNFPQKKDYLLYIGRIERQKGLLPLINAYAAYLKESPKKMPLKVIGSINQQDYYDQVLDVIRGHNIEEKVSFFPMQDDISPFLREANAIIISSLTEGFGFCMTEAMFNECPVVGYDVSGTHVQFENGLKLTGSDIGYRYRTISELKDALLKIESVDNSDIVKNAWYTVNKLYSKEVNLESIYSYYNYILSHE